jgi:hypothetical protein
MSESNNRKNESATSIRKPIHRTLKKEQPIALTNFKTQNPGLKNDRSLSKQSDSGRVIKTPRVKVVKKLQMPIPPPATRPTNYNATVKRVQLGLMESKTRSSGSNTQRGSVKS